MKPFDKTMNERSAILTVAGAWLLAPLFGALPFVSYGGAFSPINAVFESVSGFTTTGSSILTDIEILPKWLLFWRALISWMGGIGIIGFMLALYPIFGRVSHELLKRESSNLAGNFMPRARDVARMLGSIYVALTVLLTIILIVISVPVFDAITTAFTTISTCGFSVRNASIAHYSSVAVEITIMFFMLVSAINFAYLYGLLFPQRVRKGGADTARYFIIFLVLFSGIAVYAIHGVNYSSWSEALRYGSFQVISCATTTGFATADSAIWASGAQLMIMLVSLVGGCVGSTAGGMKFDRLVLFYKAIVSKLKHMVHPQAVIISRHEGQPVSDGMVQDAVLFLSVYIATVGLATIILTVIGLPLMESFSGAVATMGGVGPGMGTVGSMGNYSSIPSGAKLVFIFTMLLGRMEIYAFVLLATRNFWRK